MKPVKLSQSEILRRMETGWVLHAEVDRTVRRHFAVMYRISTHEGLEIQVRPVIALIRRDMIEKAAPQGIGITWRLKQPGPVERLRAAGMLEE